MADVVPSIDEQTRQIVKDRINSALSLSGDYEDNIASGKIKEFKPTEVNYGNEGVQGAISNKFNKITSDEVNRIKQLNKLNAPQESFKQLSSAATLGGKQYQIDQQRELAIRQRRMAEESQRAQLLGTMLGVAGTVAGGIYGGPMGAAAGGAAGNAVGKKVGGE